jgi:hypothetical protein
MFRTRPGSTQLISTNAAHSLARFDSNWYVGASTILYAGADSIKTGLSGDRLSFTAMQPTAGIRDRLYVAAGDTLVKVDPFTSIVNDAYKWTASGSGTSEYYCELFAGGDPSITSPDALILNDAVAVEGTAGSLTAGQWDYGDNDTLGYNTVYVRTSDSADPDTKADDYVRLVYVYNWGITAPDDTLSVADGGAGGELDDGAVYKYNVTFKSSVTGVRSNPASFGIDSDTKLLLHCDGADTHTTFTDASPSAHGNATVVANAQGDTAQKKFGTASLLCDGTDDYIYYAKDADWAFGSEPFTVDFWVRFNTVAANVALWQNYEDGNNFVYCYFNTVSGLIYFSFANGVIGRAVYTSSSISADTWYHIACIRGWDNNDDKFAITLDGTMEGQTTGFALPQFDATFDIGKTTTGGGNVFLNGWIDEFRVSKGVARWTENFTAPSNAYADNEVDLVGGSTSIDITGIPVTSDPQVDTTELWRTTGGGSIYYHLIDLVEGTTTYTDDIADGDLGTTELPTNNTKPYSWFDDCFGPFNASMFWISRTQAGERGRLYYSPIGRAEAMDGFIEVCADDAGLQRGFVYKGALFLVGKAGWYQVFGTNPYFSRVIGGAPGTRQPHTAVITPIGIMYEADDGVRIFNGSSSVLATDGNVQRLFRGDSGGSLTSFTGVVAAYYRNEYFISDETQCLAYHIHRKRWRDVGDLNIKAFAGSYDTDVLAAATNADGIYELEKEGDTDDNSNAIEIDIETAHRWIGDDKGGVVKHVHVNHESQDTSGETLTVYLEHDGSETNLGTVSQGTTRAVDTLPVNRVCKEFGIRITGSVDDVVTIHSISADVNVRGEEQA